MEHSAIVAEPLMDFNCNLAELLAVDLEQSSDVFQSRQLTAGAPAPGLADDGTRRRYSFQHSSSYLSPVFPSQPLGTLSSSKSLQTIHQKYSDVFAPLDFSSRKRGSISSSDYSADLEPPSISTREESVLTVDTWLESEKQPSPTFLHMSPTTEYATQNSWIDLEVEDLSPVTTQRRRSSMTDFPEHIQQLRGSNEIDNLRTMSMNSRIFEGADIPRTAISGKLPTCPAAIPRRRSSLQHQEAYIAAQRLAQYFNGEEPLKDTPRFTSARPQDNDTRFTYGDDADTSFPGDKASFTFRDDTSTPLHNDQTLSFQDKMTSKPQLSENGRDVAIASAEVGFDEWLLSDMAHFGCEDQLLPRPLPANTLETIQFFVTNFPEPMLMCNGLLIEKIRDLCHGVRYNTECPISDTVAASGRPSNNHQQSKSSKWKWLSSPSMKEKREQPEDQSEDQPDILPVSKGEWKVMQTIFPYGSDDLCEALYAYVLAYNYITLLCRRSMPNGIDVSRPTTPWAGNRPGTGRSALSAELDMYGLTPPRLSMSEANGIPRKAASILGMGEEDIPTPPPFMDSTRPSSGDSGSRTSTFTSFRGIPSFFFNGISQGQQRQSESRGSTTRPNTVAGRRSSFTRPMTPAASRTGMRSMTSLGQNRPDQVKQLLELRRGLALCCARLTVTLHRASPNTTKQKDDKDCRVDPSFMRSLCENVRITEEAMGRSK
ncbi:hypothetical protein HD806DRAFT_531546 [Xylariaceae sp. AK1471]|nr:hypothetical protein HD806DRAFT_531546 [Xylariaceae sp. AK1471]